MVGVPDRNPVFTGREAELAAIHEGLGREVTALTSVALQGLGGEGKTQTAVEYAYSHAEEYVRILFVRAEREGEFESGLSELAGELGLPVVADQEANLQAVRNWFDTHEGWLLIVDNAERLSELRPKLPKGRVLVTTRETVPPRFGRKVEINHLDDDAGALLLLRSADRLAPEQTLDDADEADRDGARTISRELLGLALALDHAGSYILHHSVTLASYLDLYRHHRTKVFDDVESPDHATVTVTFRMAVEQVEAIPEVGPAAAQLIRLCAFLAPDEIPDEIFRSKPDSLEARARAHASDDLQWNRLVEAATRFSLLRRQIHPQGLSLHRLVAEVLRDSMSEEEQAVWTEQAALAVSTAFPKDAGYSEWAFLARLLPHIFALRDANGDLGVASEHIAHLLNQAALYIQQRGRYQEAIDFQAMALAQGLMLYPGDHPNIATGLSNLGSMLSNLGRYDEAMPFLESAIAMDARMPNTDDLVLVAHFDNLAFALQGQRRTEEAVEILRHTLELTQERLGPNHIRVSTALNNLVTALIGLELYDEAEPLILRSLAIKRAIIGDDHPETATTVSVVGSLYLAWGQLDKAEEPLRRHLEMMDAIHKDEHPHCAMARQQLAHWHSLRGELFSACDLLKVALAIKERLLGPDHPDTQSTRQNLGFIEARIKAEGH